MPAVRIKKIKKQKKLQACPSCRQPGTRERSTDKLSKPLCVSSLLSVSIHPPPPLSVEGSSERSSKPSLSRAEGVVKSLQLCTVWRLWVQSDSCSSAALCTSYVILVWLEGGITEYGTVSLEQTLRFGCEFEGVALEKTALRNWALKETCWETIMARSNHESLSSNH